MRERLDDAIGSTTTVDRREGAIRRFGIPALVAAAVAALAIGGYVIADDGGGADPSPAGQGDQGPKEDGAITELKEPTEAKAKALADPDPAYLRCIALALAQYELRGEPISEKLVGKLAIGNELGTTVVVANSTDAYTCNVRPDQAVSHPSALNGTFEATDLWFALNATRNVVPGDKGDMVWVGGEVPEGVTGISYAFPDGHTEEAVVRDGFWALQYFSDEPIPSGPNDWVTVTLDGDGRAYEIPFTGETMCNQVSHGC